MNLGRRTTSALAAVLVAGAAGTSYAVVAGSPANAESTTAATASSAGPVADLLAGSYSASDARLSEQDPRVRNRVAPSVEGRPLVGAVLAVDPGTWAPRNVSLRYQWVVDGAPVAGETDPLFTLDAADLGSRVSVKVTGRRSGYRPLTVTSPITTAVKPGRIDLVRAPAVSGKAIVGRKLTASTGRWAPRVTDVDYQWFRGARAIAGATRATYKVVGADAGDRLRVVVTVSRRGYKDASATSARTAAVTRR